MIKKVTSKQFPVSYLFPNIVTIIGLCFGMSSIKYALDGRWEISVGLLVISAFIDGMDGRLARMLDASSKFGAELDSLTDFINFGVAPALILYFWGLNMIPIKGIGWAIALIYTVCCAFRLARFNVNNDLAEKEKSNFFLGIPAPCGAGLTLVPIMLSFELKIYFFADNPFYLAIYMMVIAILMASQIPTISTKNTNISHKLIYPILILITIFIASLIIEPWIMLPLMGLVYIFTIPISVMIFLASNSKVK